MTPPLFMCKQIRLILRTLLVIVTVPTTRGAEVLKSDDTLVKGTIVAFDGRSLRIEPADQHDSTSPVSIPAREVARVEFSSRPPGRSAESHRNPVAAAAAGPEAPPVLLPSQWRLTLDGGDALTGSLRSWSESSFEMDLHDAPSIVHVPVRSIREIWRAAPDLIRRARDLNATARAEDVAYVLKGADVVAVKGTALGVEDLELGFLFEGRRRAIRIENVLGVVLAPQKRSADSRPASQPAGAPPGPAVTIAMVNGDTLRGRWTLLKDGFMSIATPWGETVDLPTTAVQNIETRDDRAVFLSDLKPLRVEQTPYFDRVIPWRADAALDGGPLRTSDGRGYAHGLATHSRCVLEYDLGGRFARFDARLGFEPIPSGQPPGSVAVRVLIDGAPRYENLEFSSDQKPVPLAIDVRGATRLTLEVDFGRDQDVNDRVVWGNARLLSDDVQR